MMSKEVWFTRALSSAEEIMSDEEVNRVVIGTRHDLHAKLSRQALAYNRMSLLKATGLTTRAGRTYFSSR